MWRTFNNLVNVHGCNDECGDIHGKEFLIYSKFHHEFWKSHFEANFRHICKIGGRTRWDQWFGQYSLGKEFMETTVTDWWRNRYQSLTRKSLRLLRFCVVPREDPSTSRIQQCLEGQDRMGHNWWKLQRLWRNQWRADWIRVEYFPRIHNVAALR